MKTHELTVLGILGLLFQWTFLLTRHPWLSLVPAVAGGVFFTLAALQTLRKTLNR